MIAMTPSAPAPADTLHTAIQDVLTRTPKRPPRPPEPGGAGAGDRARLIAAVVLDVLAGNRTPGDAASALGLSVARYYVIEQQAIDGLIAGCGPRPIGRQKDPAKDLTRLSTENQRLTQALLRQQALVRAGQRSLGVAAPAKPAPSTGGPPGRGKGKRQPKVRALRAVKRLHVAASSSASPAVSTTPTPSATTPGDHGGG